MANFKSKIAAVTIALLLVSTIAVSLAVIPAVKAQGDYRTKKTYAMCGLMPNPVGVGQEVLVWVAITDYVQNPTDGWVGLTVTVTKPDGTTETLGPFRTDATGSTGATYRPSAVGTYSFQTHFPQQWFNWTSPPMFDPEVYGNILYQASDSEVVSLTVTEEPVPEYQASPLPTFYWTRPIDAQHRTWNTISANWEKRPTNAYAPNNDYAPEAGHILWAKPLALGGLAGGYLGEQSYESGDAYEGKFVNSVIINGILYYNRYAQGFGGGWSQQGIFAVDLRTGEELWFKNNSRLAFGQTFYWDSFNMHGVFSYVYESISTFDMNTFTSVTTWKAYDPLTGEWQFSISNIPSTGAMFGASYTQSGPHGEIIIYNIDLARGWVAKWNSTRAVLGPVTGMAQGSWGSAANTQRTFDGNRGYEWNKTLSAGPGNLPGSVTAVLDDRVVGCTAGGWTSIGEKPVALWSFSLKPGQEGTLLYNTTWQPPVGDLSVSYGETSKEDGVFTIEIKETRQIYGFDLTTGQKIWGPTESQAALNIYGISGAIAYGKLFCTGYAGILYCYDVKTGELLWTYAAKDPYNEILWSNDWPIFVAFITDGKIYMQHNEHSPVNPLSRGAPFVCIDIETGEKIWELPLRTTSWGGGPVIGDSIIALYNSYDSQIYAIGKGPSATTVTAPNTAITLGQSFIISGTVTDESPASKAKGTAAISDESMSEWMKYIYLQFPRPTNATGVEVTISVVDSNGNYREIGTATSSSDGFYSLAWTPDIEGKYNVYADFAGSESYYPSHAETAFVVDPAPPAPTEPEPQLSMTDTYIAYAAIGIIAAVAVVGAVIVLILRKR